MMTAVSRALSCIAILVAVASAAAAQETFATAVKLYASAEYEHALKLLDGLATTESATDVRQSIELYRALCFLAVGRRDDADRAIEGIIARDPLYRPSDDLSPRMRLAFTETKRRLLPGIIRKHYTEAKTAFDQKDFVVAEGAFKRVIDALDDPDLGPVAAGLADLRMLATGFRDLSVKAIPPPPPAPPPPAPVREPLRIYTADDREVTPPVTLRQDVPAFPGAVRPGGFRGVLDVVINEDGSVELATLSVPIMPAFDKMVLAASKQWRYVPATVEGKPVKFRRRISINVAAP